MVERPRESGCGRIRCVGKVVWPWSNFQVGRRALWDVNQTSEEV